MGRAKDQKAPEAQTLPPADVTAEVAPGLSPESAPPPAADVADPVTDLATADEIETPVDPAGLPFGKPMVIVHKKEDGGTGIPASAMQAQPLEPEYVEPGDRSNPEYLAKLAAEKAADDELKAKADKAKRAFGFGTRPVVFGGSPNSPQAKINLIS